MISHKHKAIFVHVPKTAGQSIEHYFLQENNLTLENKDQLLIDQRLVEDRGSVNMAHLTAAEYKEFNLLTDQQWDEYYSFAFTRNPWARMVSFYKYMRYYQVMTFDNFLLNQLDVIWENEYWFLRPQHEFILDREGNQLVDYIGKFENLQDDFNKIARKLDIKNKTLPIVNKSKPISGIHRLKEVFFMLYYQPKLVIGLGKDNVCSQNYRDYYTDELIDKVAEVYKNDIRYFNYAY